MAEVFLGRILGPGGFQRPVALKRILPHLTRSASFRDMFLDEARIVARIRHDNVVAIHELVSDGGELFMVLEYLEGESAAGLMRRLAMRGEFLDFALAAHICAEACAGLHAAHELADASGANLKLVHRDVSPQNVFVTYDGQVKVLDFGIAKAADRTVRTETGHIKGKFEYMSPEQCQDKPIDRRSDVFALGTLLFELSTGRRLFQRANQLLTMRAICDEPLVVPSSITQGYPPGLEQVCLRALARDPSDRYATAALMRTALLAVATQRAQPPKDELATLMRNVFSDRVAEKSEMLRQVRAGAQVTRLPAPETDPEVELASVAQTVTKLERLRARPGRNLAVLAGVFASMLALATVAWLNGLFRSDVNVVPTPPPREASPQPVPPSKPVTLHIETVPAQARVIVAGESRGTTPLQIELPRSSEPVMVDIALAGFQPFHQTVVPAVDQRLLVTLVEAQRPAPATRRAAKPKGRPLVLDAGFHRFD
jgi:serine/threonine-protein kinase